MKAPLSGLDKFIYIFTVIAAVALIIVFWVLLGFSVRDWIAYSDPRVIALERDWGVLSAFIFSAVFFIPMYSFPCYWYSKKYPIFGNKKFKPKGYARVIPSDRLFSKEYFESLSKKYKRTVKMLLGVWGVVSLVLLCVVLIPIQSRTVLYDDSSIAVINWKNEVTSERELSSANKVYFGVGKSSSGGRYGNVPSYGLVVSFEYDDQFYSFSIYEFKYSTLSETLRYMLALKKTVGKNYQVRGIEHIDNFIREDKLDSAEISLLYELLDYKNS
jgi:hypothetical protein